MPALFQRQHLQFIDVPPCSSIRKALIAAVVASGAHSWKKWLPSINWTRPLGTKAGVFSYSSGCCPGSRSPWRKRTGRYLVWDCAMVWLFESQPKEPTCTNHRSPFLPSSCSHSLPSQHLPEFLSTGSIVALATQRTKESPSTPSMQLAWHTTCVCGRP